MVVVLLSIIPVYLAQRLTSESGGAIPGGRESERSDGRAFASGRMDPMIELTEWARDILHRAQAAAGRFDPDARLRLARTGAGVQAVLVHEPEPGDGEVAVDEETTLFVESGLDGLVDVEEPHDRLVLRPLGSTPNDREHH
jgi:hypothetical protein